MPAYDWLGFAGLRRRITAVLFGPLARERNILARPSKTYRSSPPYDPRVPIYGLANDALPGDTGETAGGHWCGYDDWDFADAVNPDLLGVTRCAILPPGFVLAR